MGSFMDDFTPSQYIDKISYDLKYNNRFFVDKEFNALLNSIFLDYKEEICKGIVLYRARIYTEPDRFDKYNGINYLNSKPFCGYDEDNSFVNKEN